MNTRNVNAHMIGGPYDAQVCAQPANKSDYRREYFVSGDDRPNLVVPDCNGEPVSADVAVYRYCDQGHWHFEKWKSGTYSAPTGRKAQVCPSATSPAAKAVAKPAPGETKFIGGPADGRKWWLREGQTMVTVFDGKFSHAYALSAEDGTLYHVGSWPDERIDWQSFDLERARYAGLAPGTDQITIPAKEPA